MYILNPMVVLARSVEYYVHYRQVHWRSRYALWAVTATAGATVALALWRSRARQRLPAGVWWACGALALLCAAQTATVPSLGVTAIQQGFLDVSQGAFFEATRWTATLAAVPTALACLRGGLLSVGPAALWAVASVALTSAFLPVHLLGRLALGIALAMAIPVATERLTSTAAAVRRVPAAVFAGSLALAAGAAAAGIVLDAHVERFAAGPNAPLTLGAFLGALAAAAQWAAARAASGLKEPAQAHQLSPGSPSRGGVGDGSGQATARIVTLLVAVDAAFATVLFTLVHMWPQLLEAYPEEHGVDLGEAIPPTVLDAPPPLKLEGGGPRKNESNLLGVVFLVLALGWVTGSAVWKLAVQSGASPSAAGRRSLLVAAAALAGAAAFIDYSLLRSDWPRLHLLSVYALSVLLGACWPALALLRFQHYGPAHRLLLVALSQAIAACVAGAVCYTAAQPFLRDLPLLDFDMFRRDEIARAVDRAGVHATQPMSAYAASSLERQWPEPLRVLLRVLSLLCISGAVGLAAIFGHVVL